MALQWGQSREPVATPWKDINCLDLAQILCRQPQLLYGGQACCILSCPDSWPWRPFLFLPELYGEGLWERCPTASWTLYWPTFSAFFFLHFDCNAEILNQYLLLSSPFTTWYCIFSRRCSRKLRIFFPKLHWIKLLCAVRDECVVMYAGDGGWRWEGCFAFIDASASSLFLLIP